MLFCLAALAFGLFSIAIANLAPYLGATVVQITIVALSAIGGPMLGVFLLGLLCPFSEAVVGNCLFKSKLLFIRELNI